jgi:DNA sulfur modification protein DndC
MTTTGNDAPRTSAFTERGFCETIARLEADIQALYASDDLPWVIGYSGGKDSTACVQLLWIAIAKLTAAERRKPIYVISTDTLVENPIVATWVNHSLRTMRSAAESQHVPIVPTRLTPDANDSFWVNLIGRGYPAPRPKFRWCTSRLKINPSNRFINEVASKNGEAILVLGTRRAESDRRRESIDKYDGSTRRLLSRNGNPSLDRCWVFTPIVDWTNDDVWQYLMQVKNPWGYDNKDLLGMYQGATADGECPLVVDTSTPSCGDSRFGCYVCTLVEQDKSMQAMIRNDDEKEWMLPLAELRNRYLDIKDDRKHRDFRRMNKSLMLFNGRLVHGPYKQSYREELLRALLRAQKEVRANGPEAVRDIELVSLPELSEIRRIWVEEKHEIEDSLPGIYEEESAHPFPGARLDDGSPFQLEYIGSLRDLCEYSASERGELHFQLVRELLHVEHQYRTSARRHGMLDVMDKTLEHGGFDSAEEALAFALKRAARPDDVREPDGVWEYDDNLNERPSDDL